MTSTREYVRRRLEAHAALLAVIAPAPEEVPCLNPPPGLDWLTEDAQDQERAALLCSDCPAIQACTAYAHHKARDTFAGVLAGMTGPEQERALRRKAATAARDRAAVRP